MVQRTHMILREDKYGGSKNTHNYMFSFTNCAGIEVSFFEMVIMIVNRTERWLIPFYGPSLPIFKLQQILPNTRGRDGNTWLGRIIPRAGIIGRRSFSIGSIIGVSSGGLWNK